MTLDLYVDADFAGLWNYEEVTDPSCVRSRTGYVITMGNIPVTWQSKLQTEVALSTMESEYIAASYGMRSLLPMRDILKVLCKALNIHRSVQSTVSTVWEDNAAALILMQAPLPKMTPRSKHIAVKYHWFREHFSDTTIIPKKIASEQQKADIFTKALRQDSLERNRLALMGW